MLSGGGGADVLTGGTGRDVFEFGATRFGQSPDIGVSPGRFADKITDFAVGRGKIALYLNAFVGLYPPGDEPIARADFGLFGAADLTGRERVLYDPTTGNLFKTDTGHIGNGATSVFAHVTPGTALTFHDFVWFTVDVGSVRVPHPCPPTVVAASGPRRGIPAYLRQPYRRPNMYFLKRLLTWWNSQTLGTQIFPNPKPQTPNPKPQTPWISLG